MWANFFSKVVQGRTAKGELENAAELVEGLSKKRLFTDILGLRSYTEISKSVAATHHVMLCV